MTEPKIRITVKAEGFQNLLDEASEFFFAHGFRNTLWERNRREYALDEVPPASRKHPNPREETGTTEEIKSAGYWPANLPHDIRQARQKLESFTHYVLLVPPQIYNGAMLGNCHWNRTITYARYLKENELIDLIVIDPDHPQDEATVYAALTPQNRVTITKIGVN